jgi:hypothetical protein
MGNGQRDRRVVIQLLAGTDNRKVDYFSVHAGVGNLEAGNERGRSSGTWSTILVGKGSRKGAILHSVT